MCICINCQHVKDCTTYKIILIQHNQRVSSKSNTIFTPSNTLIQININQNLYSMKLEWDLVECASFVEKPGFWLI
uniref:hypothetical protein n=1 Tax=Hypnea brasiliensis TaxID=1866962 RepID=UPI0023F05242|nr:hypothetical protein P8481_pgp145 [Hypnea brasiliensis]WCH55300.1 hypothetical protein [Hypnea brasiliensis]WDY84727.1 hypothetical protein [Hypnea brasiliensis]